MKHKKIVAIAATSLLAVSGALNSIGSVAFASESSPKMTFKIVYETESTIRADVILENFPDFNSFGFHVELGEGWEAVTIGQTNGVKRKIYDFGSYLAVQNTNNPQEIFLCGAFYSAENRNGTLISFYIKKSDVYTDENATINYSFQSSPAAEDKFVGTGGTVYLDSSTPPYTPVMYDTSEYIIGDVNNDGRIDATDASAILVAINEANVYYFKVHDISHNFHNYFPNALAPAAPDADQDDKITILDAQAIMDYYSNVSTSNNYEGAIGSKDIYEFYED